MYKHGTFSALYGGLSIELLHVCLAHFTSRKRQSEEEQKRGKRTEPKTQAASLDYLRAVHSKSP